MIKKKVELCLNLFLYIVKFVYQKVAVVAIGMGLTVLQTQSVVVHTPPQGHTPGADPSQ